MLAADALTPHVVARLFDFLGDRSPWQRRLWLVGTMVRLREAEEAIQLSGTGHGLRESSVKDAQASARDLAKNDPGVGSANERSLLAGLLSNSIQTGSEEHHRLSAIIESARANYLERWRAELVAAQPRVEFVARVLAAHLLDGGSSPGHLYRWLEKLEHDSATYSLPDIVEMAKAQETEREIEVLVPLKSMPPFNEMPIGWRSAAEVEEWLQRNVANPPSEIDDVPLADLAGGFVMSQRARDPGAAVAMVADVVETYRSRIEIGSKHAGLLPASIAFVAGSARGVILHPQRGVEIRALEREERLFAVHEGLAMDSALQLVGLLEHGSPPAAVAGAWAAVESLLKAPGDGGAHNVVPRLAALVTCSFVRAELTTLAWRQIRRSGKTDADKALSKELRELRENGPRAARVAELMLNGKSLNLAKLSDGAAEQRLLKILQTPKVSLGEVSALAADPLARFYRQRNLVLHAGKTDAVALRPSLRTTTPLIGAALDRMAHAWFVDNVEPIRLAAVARLRLDRLETPDTAPLTALLE